MEVILGRLLSLNPAGERRERRNSGEHAFELSHGKGEGAGGFMQHLPSSAKAGSGMSTPWYCGYKSLLHPSRPYHGWLFPIPAGPCPNPLFKEAQPDHSLNGTPAPQPFLALHPACPIITQWSFEFTSLWNML